MPGFALSAQCRAGRGVMEAPVRPLPVPGWWTGIETVRAGKKLLVILNFTARADHFPGTAAPWDGVQRDQEMLDHLSASGIPVFDMNDVHRREYEPASGPGWPWQGGTSGHA